MSKDDKDTKRRITIMERRNLFEPDSEGVMPPAGEVDCWVLIPESFATTEDAKKYLRTEGKADTEYLIVQAKANVTLAQKTVTKLIPTEGSVVSL